MKSRTSRLLKAFAVAGLVLLGSTAQADLGLQVEINPNPAMPGETLGAQIMVSNPDGATRTGIVLRMVYPVGLAALSHAAITSGGTCAATVSNNAACDATELLTWNLGALDAGAATVVDLPPTIAGATLPGAVITFAPEVEDDTATIVTASESIDVVASRVLQLALTEVSQDPVGTSGDLVYQLSYGFTDTSVVASGTVMTLPVPAGLTFDSADGGGALNGGVVEWSLGTLLPGATGERRATFSIAAGASAGETLIGEATLEDSGGQVTTARAVTRIESPPALGLALTANPNPARPGDVLGVTITVANSSFFDRAGVVLEMSYPKGLQYLSNSAISSGGACVTSVSNNAGCDATERLVWSLGTLAAGSGITVNLPPSITGSALAGSLIDFTAQVTDTSGELVMASDVVAVMSERPLHLALTEVTPEPAGAGGQIEYQLDFGHTATSAVAPGSLIRLPVPAGLMFVSADGGGALAAGAVQWAVGTLLPGQSGRRRALFDVNVGVLNGTAVKAEALLVDTGGQRARADEVTRFAAASPLAMAITAFPNPAAASDTLGVELTVSNTSFFPRSDVVVTMRYPVGLQYLSNSAVIGSGICSASVSNNAGCDATEPLIWTIGTLPAGAGVTLSLPPVVNASAIAGSLIGFDAEAADSAGAYVTDADVIPISAERPLRLSLSEVSPDPLPAGSDVTYQLDYGYTATSTVATGATIALPVPDGLTFVSADNGGTLNSGEVQWSLGNLLPGAIGERRVVFTTAGGAQPGLLTRVDALLSDSSNESARAAEVTRTDATPGLALAFRVIPNPVEPGEILSAQLTVTNTSFFARSDVIVRSRYPIELAYLRNSAFTDGGICVASVSNNGGCDAGEPLSWNLGTLAAGEGITVDFPPVVSASVPAGSLIPFDAEVSDSGGDKVSASEVVPVSADRSLELVLSELGSDPAIPGGNVTYVLDAGFSAESASSVNAQLELVPPAGLTFVSANDGGVLAGDRVTWSLGTLATAQVESRQAVFSVPAGTPMGSLAKAEATMTDNSGERAAADAVTRYAASVPLTLAINAELEPARPDETLAVELTVGNTSPFERANVVLKMRYPTGLKYLVNSATGGGSCAGSVSNNGGCDGSELLTWSLGTIPAGGTVTVSLPPEVEDAADVTDGGQLEFVAWVEDSSARSRRTDVMPVGYGDRDADNIHDTVDNCFGVFNPNQEDTNGDSIGNFCDADLNNDCSVNLVDLIAFKAAFSSSGVPSDADFNGDNNVNLFDLVRFKQLFGRPPGPSASGVCQ